MINKIFIIVSISIHILLNLHYLITTKKNACNKIKFNYCLILIVSENIDRRF